MLGTLFFYQCCLKYWLSKTKKKKNSLTFYPNQIPTSTQSSPNCKTNRFIHSHQRSLCEHKPRKITKPHSFIKSSASVRPSRVGLLGKKNGTFSLLIRLAHSQLGQPSLWFHKSEARATRNRLPPQQRDSVPGATRPTTTTERGSLAP